MQAAGEPRLLRKALRRWREALAVKPDHAGALEGSAQLLHDLGRPEEVPGETPRALVHDTVKFDQEK